MSQSTVTPKRRTRRPGQGMLLAVAALLVIGGIVPWLYTPLGEVSGLRGPGLWTMYAGMLALAGGIVPLPRLATVQGLICGVAGVLLPAWQVVHMLRLVGTQGWFPGPGLVLTLGGGVLALFATHKLWTGLAHRPDGS